MRAGTIAAIGQAKQQTKYDPPLDVKGDASPRPWKRYTGWPARDMSKFNTLANLASPPAPKEPRKIEGEITGDAKKGGELVADRNRGGSCLACHVMGPAGGANLPGNVGPDLSEIGNAGREDEWLFNYVYDGRVYNPETVMPPWGTHELFNEQEIRDIVAFLKTLKSPAPFRTALDDPEKRPPPVEKRDNLDPLENPGMWAVDRAQALWKQRTAVGFSCNSCHNAPQTQFKTWAATMPKWEPRLGKVLGVEEFVTRHAKATTGADWLMETDDNKAMSVYLQHWRMASRSRSIPRASRRKPRSNAARTYPSASLASSTSPAPIATAFPPINGSAASGSASRAGRSTISRPGAPACRRSGTFASASSGVRSISAPMNCRPTPRNMAISSSI